LVQQRTGGHPDRLAARKRHGKTGAG
jgi:hypothetical protein